MFGMNPRDVQKAMQRMGIKQEAVDATEVVIKTKEKEIVIKNPQVAKVNMMGQETWQVIGQAVERAIGAEPEISDEDIKTVMEQAGVSKAKALESIKKHKGDLAEAILELQK